MAGKSFFKLAILKTNRSKGEWDNLAKWVINNKLFSHNVRWLIQLPRLYDIYKSNNQVECFQDILESNIVFMLEEDTKGKVDFFQPLFEVTQNPASHPELHVFLRRVVGFDSVDDESKAERRIHKKYPAPSLWTSKLNPPYAYWLYYIYANLCSLNHWRQVRGFSNLPLSLVFF